MRYNIGIKLIKKTATKKVRYFKNLSICRLKWDNLKNLIINLSVSVINLIF